MQIWFCIIVFAIPLAKELVYSCCLQFILINMASKFRWIFTAYKTLLYIITLILPIHFYACHLCYELITPLLYISDFDIPRKHKPNLVYLVYCDEELSECDLDEHGLTDMCVQGRYLEIRNFTNKFHEYDITKKKALVRSYEIFFPQVPTCNVKGSKIRIDNDIICELQIRSSLSN